MQPASPSGYGWAPSFGTARGILATNGVGTVNHDLEIQGDLVVKRYRGCASERPAREWGALTQLAAHAPDLAPAPHAAHLDDVPPWIAMSRVPGTALRGSRVTLDQERLLAACASRLFDALPAPTLAKLPAKTWSGPWAIETSRAWCATSLPNGTAAIILQAHAVSTEWLLATPVFPSTRPVFTNGDGNLANYLCDGSDVRVVDFEYAGRSDLTTELAEITEHVSAWVDTAFDADRFLTRFDLSTQERSVLGIHRALFALEWLHVLFDQDPNLGVNPPGTAERQAQRVLARLAAL